MAFIYSLLAQALRIQGILLVCRRLIKQFLDVIAVRIKPQHGHWQPAWFYHSTQYRDTPPGHAWSKELQICHESPAITVIVCWCLSPWICNQCWHESIWSLRKLSQNMALPHDDTIIQISCRGQSFLSRKWCNFVKAFCSVYTHYQKGCCDYAYQLPGNSYYVTRGSIGASNNHSTGPILHSMAWQDRVIYGLHVTFHIWHFSLDMVNRRIFHFLMLRLSRFHLLKMINHSQ